MISRCHVPLGCLYIEITLSDFDSEKEERASDLAPNFRNKDQVWLSCTNKSTM